MKKKYIWRVDPAPTGKWKSFERRAWPEMWVNDGSGTMLAQIVEQTGESYRPTYRAATDLALKVRVYKFRANLETGKAERSSLISTLSFKSIADAKAWAEKVHNLHPEWTNVKF